MLAKLAGEFHFPSGVTICVSGRGRVHRAENVLFHHHEIPWHVPASGLPVSWVILNVPAPPGASMQ
jgi:hypothetical protein